MAGVEADRVGKLFVSFLNQAACFSNLYPFFTVCVSPERIEISKNKHLYYEFASYQKDK